MLNIKSFQETLHSGMCGPASLKMVLSYYGKEMEEQELAKLCEVDVELGTNSQMICKAAESLGFTCEVKDNSSYEDIQIYLDKKIPVIVNWFTRGRSDYDDSQVPDGHYSVVVGLDEENIYLEDPEIGGMRKIERDDFYRAWFDFEGDHIEKWDQMIIRQIIAISK